ncbi:hypothetical protein ABIC47_002057 [Leifsonia sp. 563]
MSREIRISARQLAGQQARIHKRAQSGDRIVVRVGRGTYRLAPSSG